MSDHGATLGHKTLGILGGGQVSLNCNNNVHPIQCNIEWKTYYYQQESVQLLYSLH